MLDDALEAAAMIILKGWTTLENFKKISGKTRITMYIKWNKQ